MVFLGPLVWDLIDGLGKVQQDHIDLGFVIEAFGQEVDSDYQLTFT